MRDLHDLFPENEDIEELMTQEQTERWEIWLWITILGSIALVGIYAVVAP